MWPPRASSPATAPSLSTRPPSGTRSHARSLAHMRGLELVVCGSVLAELSVILTTRIAEFTAKGDATSVAAVQYQLLAAWCLLIFIYGIFMPNTWQRGALVMIPMAIVPYLV